MSTLSQVAMRGAYATLPCILTLCYAQSLAGQLTEPSTANDADRPQTTEMSVLEEGPIHEAFAEPLSSNVDKGIVVDRQPPEPIDEIPPQHRPQGDNVEWIPGYWFWLEDRDDFVWVSGVWRSIPPGRQWTPGHWSKVLEGYRWINGFWTDTQSPQVEYLPYPPESLENGPNSPPPSEDQFWIPGHWYWNSNRYAWRPGYWYPGQSDWMWVPHHYVYTPRGAIFVSGYWDYPLQTRGLLYAPVYWGDGYRGGYQYVPSQLVNTALLLTSLFIDSNRGYYYYGPRYRGHSDFYPWYGGYQGGMYNPLFGYYSSQFGHDVDLWRDRYDRRRRGERDGGPKDRDARLVGTWEDLRDAMQQESDTAVGGGGHRSLQLTNSDQEAARERIRDMARFRDARAAFEAERDNDFHARIEDGQPDDRNGPRQAQVTIPEDYRPPTFDLQSVDGADRLRRRAMARDEITRQNLDQGRERGEQRSHRDLRSDRRNHSATQSQDLNRPEVRQRRPQPPVAPQDRQIDRRGDRQPNSGANRGRGNPGEGNPKNPNRGAGRGGGRGNNA